MLRQWRALLRAYFNVFQRVEKAITPAALRVLIMLQSPGVTSDASQSQKGIPTLSSLPLISASPLIVFLSTIAAPVGLLLIKNIVTNVVISGSQRAHYHFFHQKPRNKKDMNISDEDESSSDNVVNTTASYFYYYCDDDTVFHDLSSHPVATSDIIGSDLGNKTTSSRFGNGIAASLIEKTQLHFLQKHILQPLLGISTPPLHVDNFDCDAASESDNESDASLKDFPIGQLCDSAQHKSRHDPTESSIVITTGGLQHPLTFLSNVCSHLVVSLVGSLRHEVRNMQRKRR